MALVLYHHPFSRAANVLWMLEELGQPYELRYVDIMKGEQKSPEILKLNPMGKLPILVDGDAVVTESAAIALYLADRYSSGTLAPKLDDPARATYLRWTLFAPSVIEPGTMAKQAGWSFKPSQAGWGTTESMMAAIEQAIAGRSFVLGDRFSMADCVYGGTVGYMLRFKMLDATPTLSAYVDRLHMRPAFQRSEAKNAQIAKDHSLG